MSWDPRIALGLAVAEGVASQDEGAMLDALDARCERDGRHPATFAIWVNWGDLGWDVSPRWSLPSLGFLSALADRGVAPMIFWQPVQGDSAAVPFADILAGQWDAHIDAFAAAAAAFGGRIIVRFAHEGNAPWFPWAVGKVGNTRANTRAAHAYVHDRVRAIAPRVAMFWCPNATQPAYVPYADLYPGNDAVQFVGFDSYQWSGTGGKMPADIWRPSMQALKAVTGGTRAVIVGETGIKASGSSGDAAFRRAWLRDGLREVHAEWPVIAGIVLFDIDMTDQGQPDWRIASTPTLTGAWRGLLADPDFGGSLR